MAEQLRLAKLYLVATWEPAADGESPKVAPAPESSLPPPGSSADPTGAPAPSPSPGPATPFPGAGRAEPGGMPVAPSGRAAAPGGLFDFPNLLRRLWSVAEQPPRRDAPSPLPPAGPSEVRTPPASAPERKEPRAAAPVGRAMPFPAWGPRLPASSAFRDPPPAALPSASRTPASPVWNGASSPTVSGGLSIRNRAWICPGCHAANAPWSTVCPVCRGGTPLA